MTVKATSIPRKDVKKKVADSSQMRSAAFEKLPDEIIQQ